ncbi:MAG: glycoside hydrolase family 3 C-terminal domain-containing protein [Lachnospiraceae bacterium]|nr:glycoside hydrolase family 3 C-terminal domain-containing protein [Lachnospiraceae bacterium]
MNQTELKEKARELMKKLTLEEKIGMIHGAALFQTKGVERLGILPLKMSDGPMGIRQEFEPNRWMTVGYSDDYVTYLPCNSALAATWNRTLAREMGSVLGEEARGRGKDVILAPGINIKRSPLCGRNFEYFSEDPFLTAKLAVPFIQGVQLWDVAACVKHFAVNNQETERLWVDVEIDEEALRTIYLPAFYEALKEGGAYTVMGAYNKVRGEHCCQSDYLLRQILREEWQYDGVVISDWGAVHDTRLSAESELDIEMSVTDDFDEYCMANPLLKKIREGEIREEVVDEKVTRILMLMMRLHMMDGKRKAGTYNSASHRETALRVARESVVLLKNDKGRLPLSPEKMKRVLVIGDNAEAIHSCGGGSAEIKALYEISPLMGIHMVLGGNTDVTFCRGYCRDAARAEGDLNWQAASLENGGTIAVSEKENREKQEICTLRQQLREEAVREAANGEYDAVLFVGGLNHDQDSEGNDRSDMKLPYEQDALICRLLEVRPDTVIVLNGGSPVEMNEWIDQADTLVWGWYAGIEGGRALAEVLFGLVNPSGKLPETFYKKHTDCSAHCIGEFPGGKTVSYKEGVFVGYRYNDTFAVAPQFCFGHGLSYTDFSYEEAWIAKEEEKSVVCCRVANIGEREGMETVQVYLAPKHRKENQPVQELKGFVKVELKPKEKTVVQIPLENLPNDCEVRIGSSSRDIRCRL